MQITWPFTCTGHVCADINWEQVVDSAVVLLSCRKYYEQGKTKVTSTTPTSSWLLSLFPCVVTFCLCRQVEVFCVLYVFSRFAVRWTLSTSVVCDARKLQSGADRRRNRRNSDVFEIDEVWMECDADREEESEDKQKKKRQRLYFINCFYILIWKFAFVRQIWVRMRDRMFVMCFSDLTWIRSEFVSEDVQL